jgi:hypothetical protein
MEVHMAYRNYLVALILSLFLVLGSPPASQRSVAQADVEVSFSFFHTSLSSHGNWVVVGNYGPCWRPARTDFGWQPYYTNGHWVYTEYGWTWISYEPWGSIVYHYGTWYFDSYYGWVWVPGYVWAPAWVTWSYTDDYIGWAPLPPTFFFSVQYRPGGYIGYGYYGRPIVVHHNHYVFVPSRNFGSTNINTVRVSVEENVKIVRRAHSVTTINVVNNHIVNHGPDLQIIEPIKRSPKSYEQASGGVKIKPQSLRAFKQEGQIEITSPIVNRREAERVIRDFDREEREVRADRERQLNQERKQLKIDRERRKQQEKIEPKLEREQRRLEREQLELRERQQQEQRRIERQQIQQQHERRIERDQHKEQEKQSRRKGR